MIMIAFVNILPDFSVSWAIGDNTSPPSDDTLHARDERFEKTEVKDSPPATILSSLASKFSLDGFGLCN